VTLATALGLSVGVLFFLVVLLFVIGRLRGRSPSNHNGDELSVSRSWLVEHQARQPGE
jgi:hypothetical protein